MPTLLCIWHAFHVQTVKTLCDIPTLPTSHTQHYLHTSFLTQPRTGHSETNDHKCRTLSHALCLQICQMINSGNALHSIISFIFWHWNLLWRAVCHNFHLVTATCIVMCPLSQSSQCHSDMYCDVSTSTIFMLSQWRVVTCPFPQYSCFHTDFLWGASLLGFPSSWKSSGCSCGGFRLHCDYDKSRNDVVAQLNILHFLPMKKSPNAIRAFLFHFLYVTTWIPAFLFLRHVSTDVGISWLVPLIHVIHCDNLRVIFVWLVS
jgi:hypothetical protein